MSRLPQPGADIGDWGSVLNDYLLQEHLPDGALKLRTDGTLNAYYKLPSAGIPVTDLSTSLQTTITYVDQATTNIKKYGAIGDGSTNDTAAFNIALTAASGATLFIPPGTYILTPGALQNIPTGTKIQGAGIGATILKCSSGFNGNNNLIQIVSVSGVEISNLTIDGNKTSNSNFQYGLYISSSSNCSAHNLLVQNWNGDGVQLYNCTACIVHDVFSTGNLYHGFEVEQSVRCTIQNCRGYLNSVHGLIITPGEVGSQGSQGNRIMGCSFEDNTQYGICVNWDNASTGAHLSEGNIIIGNSIVGNAQYAVCFYGESHSTFTENYIFNNGYFGLYGFESAYNIIKNNYFHNNSQASNGGYDEIFFEGSSSGYASSYNQIDGNVIVIDGANKARYAYNEASGDGNNIVMNNIVPNNGSAGIYNIPNQDTTLATTNQGVQVNSVAVAPNGVLPGSEMGIDAPFGAAALRLYNPNSGGNIQVVAPHGSVNHYIGGNDVVDFINAGIQINLGYKLFVQTGTNASAGTGSLTGGIATVPTTAVTANSLILLTCTNASTTNVGTLTISSKTAGASFTVTSTNALDTSTFNWLIIN